LLSLEGLSRDEGTTLNVIEVSFVGLGGFAAGANEVKLLKKLLHTSVHVLGLASRVAVEVRALPVTSLLNARFTE